MIFSLVGTLSPALDSQFQKARRELSGKLRELTEQPPLVRTGAGGGQAPVWAALGQGPWGEMPLDAGAVRAHRRGPQRLPW